MSDSHKKFLTIGLWVAVAVIVIRYLIVAPQSLYDYFGAAGEAVAITTVIMTLYNTVLWRFNPFEKAPRLMGKYEGIIEYNYMGEDKNKETEVTIRQTALSIRIGISTDQITSNSITSDLVEENGEYALYYTYITNPKSKYSDDNPVQYGTCRVIQLSKTRLQGTYWTSRKTIGDIELDLKENQS